MRLALLAGVLAALPSQIAGDPELGTKRISSEDALLNLPSPVPVVRARGVGFSRPTNGPINPQPARQKKWRPIPDNINPGLGPGFSTGERPLSSRQYEQKGAKLLDMYTRSFSRPDTEIVKTTTGVQASENNRAFEDIWSNPSYHIQTRRIDIRTYLNAYSHDLRGFTSANIGFNLWEAREVLHVQIADANSGNSVAAGKFDVDGNFMVLEEEFKVQNHGRTPLNELIMQSFLKAAGHKAVNFKVFILQNLQNREFWDIVRKCYNENKKPFEEEAVFHRNTRFFNRLIGSPNLGSKFYGFANHHHAIADKIPQKIVIQPKQMPGHVHLNVALVFH